MIKLFISHASEDKDEFVRPLTKKLEAANFDVWLDEIKLRAGDSLRKEIDDALLACDYGIVVLSPNFFGKTWTNRELAGLLALETKERKTIIPIWKGVGVQEVTKYSPMLVDRVAITAKDLDEIVHEIQLAVGAVDAYKKTEKKATWEEGMSALEQDIDHIMAVRSRSESVEGVRQVHEAAHSIIAEAKAAAENWNRKNGRLRMEFSKDPSMTLPDSLSIRGPFIPYSSTTPRSHPLLLRFQWMHDRIVNSLEGCRLNIDIVRLGNHGQIDTSQGTLERLELIPKFDCDLKVYWEDGKKRFITGQEILDFIFGRFVEILRDDKSRSLGG